MTDQERRLQIDDDWKSEAAAEKARLAETVVHKPGALRDLGAMRIPPT